MWQDQVGMHPVGDDHVDIEGPWPPADRLRGAVPAGGSGLAGGVLWFEGALYVTCMPSLWKLTDKNGDGIQQTNVPPFELGISEAHP